MHYYKKDKDYDDEYKTLHEYPKDKPQFPLELLYDTNIGSKILRVNEIITHH